MEQLPLNNTEKTALPSLPEQMQRIHALVVRLDDDIQKRELLHNHLENTLNQVLQIVFDIEQDLVTVTKSATQIPGVWKYTLIFAQPDAAPDFSIFTELAEDIASGTVDTSAHGQKANFYLEVTETNRLDLAAYIRHIATDVDFPIRIARQS